MELHNTMKMLWFIAFAFWQLHGFPLSLIIYRVQLIISAHIYTVYLKPFQSANLMAA